MRFVSLKRHSRMFEELDDLFEKGRSCSRQPAPLAVQQVGSFIASYVPTRADFDRLDPRFRVPDELFDAAQPLHAVERLEVIVLGEHDDRRELPMALERASHRLERGGLAQTEDSEALAPPRWRFATTEPRI